MATIRDVAREAGVGVGTVSRVLGGGQLVAPETRRRVEAAVLRLDYHPSPTARALSLGRRQIVEVVVPLFTREFYVEVLRGVAETLSNADYSLVVRSVERASDRDRAFAGIAAAPQSDAVIIVSLVPPDDLIARVAEQERPLILVDGFHPLLPSVAVDHESAMAAVTRHLRERGHRRVALIDRLDDPWSPVAETGRRRGYERALIDSGVDVDRSLATIAAYTADAGRDAAARLLALPDPPTALAIGSDLQAIGALDGVRRCGLRVPEDVAVIGYNDIEVAHYLGLASVHVPMRAMGSAGAGLALDQINGKDIPPVQRLAGELMIRNSSG